MYWIYNPDNRHIDLTNQVKPNSKSLNYHVISLFRCDISVTGKKVTFKSA